MAIKDNLKVGKPHASPDVSAHTRGTKEGNKGPNERQRGHLPDGRATAARSTGVNVGEHEPIDPRMPNLPPA
jgi:hypothetical protein